MKRQKRRRPTDVEFLNTNQTNGGFTLYKVVVSKLPEVITPNSFFLNKNNKKKNFTQNLGMNLEFGFLFFPFSYHPKIK